MKAPPIVHIRVTTYHVGDEAELVSESGCWVQDIGTIPHEALGKGVMSLLDKMPEAAEAPLTNIRTMTREEALAYVAKTKT